MAMTAQARAKVCVENATLDDLRAALARMKADGKASGMNLEVFEDKNNDGVADGPPKPLIEHISNAHMLAERGTDHATNGIRMGIDGWIYIAVGDFGFHDAIDRSGKKMTRPMMPRYWITASAG